MPYCPDCGMEWGGARDIPVVCLTCRCARAEGVSAPAALQPGPWPAPAPPPPAPPAPAPAQPAPLQAVSNAMAGIGDALHHAGSAAGQAADAFTAFGHAMDGAVLHTAPGAPAWIASGAYMSPDPGPISALDNPARICTCDDWEDDHDRLGCTECDGCDGFVLAAAAAAIEEAGSMHPDDYRPIGNYVRLKDGRRVAMSDIRDASAVLTRRAQANRPAAALPTHRRGIRLRGIKQKEEKAP